MRGCVCLLGGLVQVALVDRISVVWSVSVLSGPQGCAYSRVVLVVVLHHALDVEQFVPQPATLFLL